MAERKLSATRRRSPATCGLPLFSLTAFLFASAAQAAVVSYDFTVSNAYQAPDCCTKPIYVVNGLYPGPVIDVTEGDRVLVRVKNALFSEGVTIHFHGIHQKGSTFYDGTAFESQCPIEAGQDFVYNFTVPGQFGTFWWHGHFALQRSNGLYGLMIVRPPAHINERALLGYDEELEPMLLNDWWHRNLLDQQEGLVQQLPAPFVWVGNPQALLINGKGVYNCSATANLNGLACNSSNPDCGYPVFEVEQGKRYRIRLVAVSSLMYFTYSIQGHSITLVEADAAYTQPYTVQNLDINSGQTASVILKADQPVGNYWITLHTRHRSGVTSSFYTDPIYGTTTTPGSPLPLFAGAILRYKGAPASYPATPIPQTFPAWNDTEYSLTQQRNVVTRSYQVQKVPEAYRELILVGTQNRVDGVLVWAVNNHSYVFPQTPVLLQRYYNTYNFFDFGKYDKPAITWNYTQPLVSQGISQEGKKGSIIYDMKHNKTVQIVVQNTLALNNVSEQHPWHLHGHDFWVLGWGNGVYDPKTSPATFNLKNPIKRNTVTVYPYGWVAIRYTTDNPGVWPFHCHISFHLVMGMQVSVAEGLNSLPVLPENFPVCGSINTQRIKKGPIFPVKH